ncbi:hypothetical protein NP493_1729g00024 [Ridgeia piscesae]|uniref:Uncharacterized protein n=1 Tax=Ridgeia piscesae TaxID=27915 RepID=A0AAD9JW01_RIDPI|nr:hypothetical protein NP493_1729g00024 [Ridgeia piscesae]
MLDFSNSVNHIDHHLLLEMLQMYALPSHIVRMDGNIYIGQNTTSTDRTFIFPFWSSQWRNIATNFTWT